MCIRDRYTTGKDGTVTIDKLQPTTIYIQEIKVPDHLVLDSTVHSVELKAGQTASFTQTNNWKQGYIQVVKKDKKTGEVVKKPGTKFEVLSGNQVVCLLYTSCLFHSFLLIYCMQRSFLL